MPTIISILGVVLGLALGGFLLFGVIWLLVKGFGLLGRFIVHVATFIGAMIADSLRLVGSILLAIVFVPLVILNIFVGRWSATSHFGRAIGSEFRAAGLSIYRLAIGHPARLLGLSSLTEGLERRLPQVIAEAPGRDKPKGGRATRLFDGYTIVGSLAGGGSGGKLYIAEPEPTKLAGFERQGFINVDKVVIKTFSLDDGSRLPQIIRESRALDAAKKMGLVLEHDMSESRFFYVMRYVPGDSLTSVTQRLHAEGGPGGLSDRALMETVGFATDLVEMLDRYHQGGLWHKDVKPDNIIVDDVSAGDGRRHAHLVDFGLVTPLRSAMTLTTHGTEYFRDPELVRQALRGAKVHQIDGGKFDVYAAGAVLFSVIENSFPAHGSLSKITKRCPESLRWIVRRSMAEYDKRYASAGQMLADLHAVLAAGNPHEIRPADLPSMGGSPVRFEPEFETPEDKPVEAKPVATPVPPADDVVIPSKELLHDAGMRTPRERARDQVRRARERARLRREQAAGRIKAARRRAGVPPREKSKSPVALNIGALFAVGLLLGGAFVGLASLTVGERRGERVEFYENSESIFEEEMSVARVEREIERLVEGLERGARSQVDLPDEVRERLAELRVRLAELDFVQAFDRGELDAPSVPREVLAEQAGRAARIIHQARTAQPIVISSERQPSYLKGRRVLVVNRVLTEMPRPDEKRLRAELGQLAERKIQLLGSPFAPPAERSAAELEEALLAQATRTRGIEPVMSAEVAARLRTLVADTSTVDAIVWLEPDPFGAESTRVGVFGPSRSIVADEIDDRLDGRVISVLSRR